MAQREEPAPSPGKAALLAALFPGAGHVYAGLPVRGALVAIVCLLFAVPMIVVDVRSGGGGEALLFLVVFYLPLHIVQASEAYREARREAARRRHPPPARTEQRRAVQSRAGGRRRHWYGADYDPVAQYGIIMGVLVGLGGFISAGDARLTVLTWGAALVALGFALVWQRRRTLSASAPPPKEPEEPARVGRGEAPARRPYP
ncbi:MAG: hypothetical protein ACYTG6_15455 [Planctomycetota bacterium]|jgi:hypothetical protein